ncbi:MAG: FeoB-associated Cys-rich membrane protein [Lachnospiraceae bacterium]|nr:FeoB-associated Cys-rich membrane protein [Lachnospiraceae bacterium]
MIAWITGNLGTILITILLLLIVAGCIRSIIRDRKQGRSTCGGSCAHCKMCTACKAARPTGQP